MFTSQKPLLPAWQTGRGRGPAGGRSRFIDAAERPGEIKVKGSSPAEDEAGPCLSIRGAGTRRKDAEAAGRKETLPSAAGPGWAVVGLCEALPPVSVGRRCGAGAGHHRFQPSPHSEYPSLVKTVTGALRAGR